MRRLVRNLRRLAILLVVLVIGIWMSLTPGDPALYPPKDEQITVHVVDHGYHSGVILDQATLRRAAYLISREDPDAGARLRWLASRFPRAEWLELGWGDAAFYQRTRTVRDIQIGLVLEALILPTDAALQVVPGWGDAAQGFPYSDVLALQLGPEGLSGLARRLADTIPDAVPSQSLGPSLYGAGAFYEAELDYHLFRTCNHWVAWLLRGAGVPASAVPGTFSKTLMIELRWRTL